MDENPYSLERLADRAAIQDVMHRWCRAIDRLDYDAIRPCFHMDAHDDHGPFKGNVEELIAWVRERHKGISFSLHLLANMLIEFAELDVALVETTVASVQRYKPDGKAALAQLSGGQLGAEGVGIDLKGASRYVDRFERRNGLWKIAQRNVVMGWRSMGEVPDAAPRMLPEWNVQQRDQTDFIFRERARLGIV